MKIRRALLVASISFAALLRAAQPAIEFSGVMTTGGKTRVALTDTATKTTMWLEPGQDFRGYTVARYEAKDDIVVLKRGGEETRLTLVPEKNSEASRATAGNNSAAAAAALAESTGNAIRANLRLLASTARQYQLQHAGTTVSYSDLVGPDKLIKEIRPVAGENYSTLTFGPDVAGVNVTTSNGMTVALELPPATPAITAPAIAAQPPEPSPTTSALTGSTTPTSNAPVTGAGLSNAPAAPATASATAAALAPDALSPTGRSPVSPNYTIQSGDTWEKISSATGVPVQQLKQMNPAMPATNTLPSGQMVRTR